MASYCSSESVSTSSNKSRIMNINSQSKLCSLPADNESVFYEPVQCNTGRRRIVFRNGQVNTTFRSVTDHHYLLFQSLFTTLVDVQWRWLLLLLVASFFISWLFFAVIWWLIALVHGDLEPGHLPTGQDASSWIPCVTGITGFTASFLFSMENQHTTGFGTRTPTEECPEAIFIMCIQAIFGVTIQTAIVGVVLAKMSRPKQCQNTILFSKNAIVCLRNGGLNLMIRIGAIQKSKLIGANLTLQFVITDKILEDEVESPFRTVLKTNEATMKNFNLMWPEMIVHKINEDSPLYDLSAEEMLHAKFEIAVVLEGTLESTNQKIQAMTSFLPEHILWGHRFHRMIEYNSDLSSYEVDYRMFDSVYAVDTPMCSERELAVLRDEYICKSTTLLAERRRSSSRRAHDTLIIEETNYDK